MSRVLVLTGATGGLGRELAARMLPVVDALIAPVRTSGLGLDRKVAGLRSFLAGRGLADAVGRLSVVPWEPAAPELGLSTEGRRAMKAATHILHCAADTRFDLSAEDAHTANVVPSRELAELARGCDALEAFGFTSTLYVAGTRTGTIREDELEPTEFVNTYESSKFEAEASLRGAMADIPICVYRVSTLMGSASTGAVPGMTAVHQALRVYHRGLVPMIPGVADEPVEVLDVDYATDALATLLLDAFEPGLTYQITGGEGACFSLSEFVDETHRLFAEMDPEWARRRIETPAIVPARIYERFERAVLDADDERMSRIVRAMGTFLPQLVHPKRFDTTNRDRALPTPRPPHLRTYYARVLERCLRTDWGRRPAEGATLG